MSEPLSQSERRDLGLWGCRSGFAVFSFLVCFLLCSDVLGFLLRSSSDVLGVFVFVLRKSSCLGSSSNSKIEILRLEMLVF